MYLFLGACWLDTGPWSLTGLSQPLALPQRYCVTLSKLQTLLEPPFPICKMRIASLSQVGFEA